jgi:hypothetical protein
MSKINTKYWEYKGIKYNIMFITNNKKFSKPIQQNLNIWNYAGILLFSKYRKNFQSNGSWVLITLIVCEKLPKGHKLPLVLIWREFNYVKQYCVWEKKMYMAM